MQEVKAPIWRVRFRVWLFLVVVCLATLDLGFIFRAQNLESTSEANFHKWETNWPQIKKGMTKEQVLALVGAPSSTVVMDSKTTNLKSCPPNQNLTRALQHMQQILDEKSNYAIWSYYGTVPLQTTLDEDLKTAMGQIANRTISLSNMGAGADGKLQGHAVRFDMTGRVAEISSQ